PFACFYALPELYPIWASHKVYFAVAARELIGIGLTAPLHTPLSLRGCWSASVYAANSVDLSAFIFAQERTQSGSTLEHEIYNETRHLTSSRGCPQGSMREAAGSMGKRSYGGPVPGFDQSLRSNPAAAHAEDVVECQIGGG